MMLELPNDLENEIFGLSCLLKLIPLEKIDNALELIKIKCESRADENENFLLFSRFVINCKPLIITQLFIKDHEKDAINRAEMFNVHLIKNLGCHQDLHKFLSEFQMIKILFI